MKNKDFNWLLFIAILTDIFFIWFNLSLMLETYHDGNFNIAAIFGCGVILWVLCLAKDGAEFRNKTDNKNNMIDNE